MEEQFWAGDGDDDDDDEKEEEEVETICELCSAGLHDHCLIVWVQSGVTYVCICKH